MGKRKTKKQKMKAQVRREEKEKTEEFSYVLPDDKRVEEKKVEVEKKGKVVKTSDRLAASYSTVIAETRFSIFVSIAIFIAYFLIYFLI